MVKFLRQSIITPELKKLYGQPLGAKIKYFWNKGWDEIPEILIASPLAILGLVGAVFGAIQIVKETRPPKYYMEMTIFRPNDPRVKTIRQDETLIPEKVPTCI